MSTFSLAIIAGGKSSRMGMDKSFVEIDGKPIIQHMMTRVADLGQTETFIVTNRPDDYATLGLPMVSDVIPDKGSLGGIYTAIYHSQSVHTLALACDMPFVNPDLLLFMIGLIDDATDVIVPRVERYPEGLHAIYSRKCLGPIKANIDADRLKVIGFYGHVNVRFVDHDEYGQFDPKGLSFFNVNTPEELEEARRLVNEIR